MAMQRDNDKYLKQNKHHRKHKNKNGKKIKHKHHMVSNQNNARERSPSLSHSDSYSNSQQDGDEKYQHQRNQKKPPKRKGLQKVRSREARDIVIMEVDHEIPQRKMNLNNHASEPPPSRNIQFGRQIKDRRFESVHHTNIQHHGYYNNSNNSFHPKRHKHSMPTISKSKSRRKNTDPYSAHYKVAEDYNARNQALTESHHS